MTAVLEHVNPYSKFGLKRRPIYDETIGLISENETLTGKLPDRTATFFKASPEGSFFDGIDCIDHLEILKEQQQRIQERQMRELMLRQNIGGGTFSVARLQQQMRENVQPDAEVANAREVSTSVQQDTNLTEASIQAQLQERARQAVDRQQQTGEAHRSGGFLSGTATPVLERIFSGLSGSRPSTPLLRMPQSQRPPPATPPRQQPQMINIASDTEVSSGEMLTAREEISRICRHQAGNHLLFIEGR